MYFIGISRSISEGPRDRTHTNCFSTQHSSTVAIERSAGVACAWQQCVQLFACTNRSSATLTPRSRGGAAHSAGPYRHSRRDGAASARSESMGEELSACAVVPQLIPLERPAM